MLLQQMKEPVAKGRVNSICKHQYQNSAFQSAEHLNFENFSQGSNNGGPIKQTLDAYEYRAHFL